MELIVVVEAKEVREGSSGVMLLQLCNGTWLWLYGL